MGFWANVIATHLRPLVGEKSGGMLHKMPHKIQLFGCFFRDLLRRKQYSASALHFIYLVVSNIVYLSPLPGEMIQFDYIMFFKRVEKSFRWRARHGLLQPIRGVPAAYRMRSGTDDLMFES